VRPYIRNVQLPTGCTSIDATAPSWLGENRQVTLIGEPQRTLRTMRSRLKIHWVCLSTLTLLFSLDMVAFELSSTPSDAHLSLNPGATANFSVVRLFPAPLTLEVEFKRNGWHDKRPELGVYRYNSNFRESGYLEFKQPGEPVIIRVTSDSGIDKLFEALPNSGYNASVILRNLVVANEDGTPHRFKWPPRLETLRAGISPLTITVVDAGPTLVGESVTFSVKPPLGFKHVAPGYGWLYWLFFWPVFVLFLAAYGAVLLWRTYRTIGQ
jgi:hypothetical protein